MFHSSASVASRIRLSEGKSATCVQVLSVEGGCGESLFCMSAG